MHEAVKQKSHCPQRAVTLLLFVAGSGIEPESGGYAYHYSFRYTLLVVFWGLDYTFIFLRLQSQILTI